MCKAYTHIYFDPHIYIKVPLSLESTICQPAFGLNELISFL